MNVQIRRATVLIGAMFIFKSMLFNKKFGKFGLLIMPDHFIMCCLLPSTFFLGFVSLAISTIVDPLYIIPIWLLLALGLIVSGKSRTFLVSFIQSQFALFIALFRLSGRRQSLLIESVQSTRLKST